jgi:hypothetical protein
VSTISYDNGTHTFPKIATNALGHQAKTLYYGVDGEGTANGLYGQVKSVTDPKGTTRGRCCYLIYLLTADHFSL